MSLSLNHRSDKNDTIKRNVFTLCCIILVCSVVLHTAVTWVEAPGLTSARIAGFAAIWVFTALIFVEHKISNLRLTGSLFVGALTAVVLYASCRNGGLTAPTTPFLLATPICAGLFVGRRAALLAAGTVAAALAFLLIETINGSATPSPHTDVQLMYMRFSGFLIATISVTAVTLGHSRLTSKTVALLQEELAHRKISENVIALKSHEYDLLFEHIPARMWLKDDKNTIVRLNTAAARSMELTVEEAEGANTAEFFPEMAEKYLRDDLDVIETGVPRLGIVEKYTPITGKTGWVRTDKAPFIDPKTGERFVIVSSIDVTSRVEAEEALKKSELRFATAAKGSSVGIWDWDIVEDVAYWTPRQYELLGYDDQEFPASFNVFKTLLHPDDIAPTIEAVGAHLNEQKPFSIEYRLKHKTEGYRWFLGTGQAIWDEEGKARRMIGSIMDIHEKKLIEEALETKAEALQRSNKELEQFARIASHDLKAPLRGIGNVADWLEEDLKTVLDEQSAENLKLMKSRIDRLEKLLDDLLSYARIDTTGDIKEVSIAQLAGEAFELVKQDGFRLVLNEDLPIFRTEHAPLELIFRNLFENAVKHHDREAGQITFSAHDLGNMFEFRIEDDGPGIPQIHQDRIFEMFTKLQSQDEVTGSGMGLSTVKKVITAHGGQIRVVSSPEERRGAIFILTWPKVAADGEVTASQARAGSLKATG